MRYTLTYGDEIYNFNRKVDVYHIIRNKTGQTTREITLEKNEYKRKYRLPPYIMMGYGWHVKDNEYKENMHKYDGVDYIKPFPYIKPFIIT